MLNKKQQLKIILELFKEPFIQFGSMLSTYQAFNDIAVEECHAITGNFLRLWLFWEATHEFFFALKYALSTTIALTLGSPGDNPMGMDFIVYSDDLVLWVAPWPFPLKYYTEKTDG